MKYLLLYKGSGMEHTPEAQAKMMQAWKEWFGKLGDSLVTPGNATGLSKTAMVNEVKDGVTGQLVGGYSIIQADNLEAAAELAKGSPAVQDDSYVEVYELMEMPEM